MRLRVLRTLFAIYRFYTDSGMDLDEDIPGLLVGNTTSQERQIIADWVRDALSRAKADDRISGSNSLGYQTVLADLERGNRP